MVALVLHVAAVLLTPFQSPSHVPSLPRRQQQLEAAVQRVLEGLCGLSGPVFGPEQQQAGRVELGLAPVSANMRLQQGTAWARRAAYCTLFGWSMPACRVGWLVHASMQAHVRWLCTVSLKLHAAAPRLLGGTPRFTCLPLMPCSTPQGPNLQQQHLHAMLQLVLPWVAPAGPAIEAARQSAAGGEERLLSACRCLLAAARVHRAGGFDAASPALGMPTGGGGLLGLLSELTTAVLAAAGSDPGWWESEASELLLDMWVELVADPCRGPMGGSQSAVGAAAAVFAAVVETGLQQAAAEAQEDEGGWGWGCVVVGVYTLCGLSRAMSGRLAVALVCRKCLRHLLRWSPSLLFRGERGRGGHAK